MKKRLTHVTIALSVLLVALAVACAPSAATPAKEKQGAPGEQKDAAPGEKAPKRGGTLTVVSTTTLAPADPAMSQTPYDVWYYVGNPMLYRDPLTWELKPGLIASWDVAKDGKEITLKVRQGGEMAQ